MERLFPTKFPTLGMDMRRNLAQEFQLSAGLTCDGREIFPTEPRRRLAKSGVTSEPEH